MRSAIAAAVAGTALVAALAACGSSTQGAASPTCDRTYVPPVEAAVTDPGLKEISGIVASRRNPGIYWVHNDSGSGPRITALDGTGSVRGVVDLAGVSPIDWEDIAIGPGPVEWRPYLYLADIGDNLLDRPEVAVVRIPEPTVDDGSGGARTVRDAVTMRFRYPDAPHNAEALVVDPRSGDLYIIVKRSRGGRQPVFRARAPIDAGRTTTLERVATVTAAPSLFGAVTAADVSRDGHRLIVRTYGTVTVTAGRSDADLVALLEHGPGTVSCVGPMPPEVQGEAVAFEPGGRSFVSISEGGSPVLRRYDPR